jgi:hypothetical protein
MSRPKISTAWLKRTLLKDPASGHEHKTERLSDTLLGIPDGTGGMSYLERESAKAEQYLS